MSSAAVRRAQTVSRMAMSPGTHNPEQDAEFLSVLNAAKQELRKEKKLKVSAVNAGHQKHKNIYYSLTELAARGPGRS